MNEKQRQFAEYYAADPNATAAAEKAGYSPKTAYAQGNRLLKNAEVIAHIQELQAAATAERIASIDDVKAFWTAVMEDESQRISDRLKASELLGKASGLFAAALAIRSKAGDEDCALAMNAGDETDVFIYLPRMMTEEECQVVEDQV